MMNDQFKWRDYQEGAEEEMKKKLLSCISWTVLMERNHGFFEDKLLSLPFVKFSIFRMSASGIRRM